MVSLIAFCAVHSVLKPQGGGDGEDGRERKRHMIMIMRATVVSSPLLFLPGVNESITILRKE